MRSGLILFVSFGLFNFNSATIDFDNQQPGSMPPYWTSTATRRAEPPRWEIARDRSAPSRPNVFAQVSTAGGESEFPLAVFDKVICRDGDLSVKFRISPGERRIQTAGIVWRYQDERNYYLLHFSVDEKNIALFHVENGQAHPVPVIGGRPGRIGVSHELRTGQWYVAKVIFRGSHFRVLFGNRQLFEAEDDSIIRAGKTALWSRAGTVVHFDDFRIDKKS
jgi:hypothetical protein